MTFPIPVWLGGPMMGAALVASAWSIRFTVADYQMRTETVGGTERAIAIAPDNAEYYARLAWLVSDDDPGKSKDALRSAVAHNPWDAGSWIELGLRAEAEGDHAGAEGNLLRAAEVDRTFVPRWTLANYYFRVHNEAGFWLWAKQAAAMARGDSRPLFRLCGKVEQNGRLMERLNVLDPDLRARYIAYLLSEKRVDLTGPAVRELLANNREADVPLLLTVSDSLLEAGRGEEARELWDGLAKAGRVAGEDGQWVVNGNFALTPTSRGLDWRMPAVEGISISREGEKEGLRVTFSGREPEDCDALVQFVPLRNGEAYELTVAYRTQGIEKGAGLRWRVSDANGGAVLGEGLSLAAEKDATDRFGFHTPLACRLVRVALRYHRAPGTIRAEGFVTLRSVELKGVGGADDTSTAP